MDADEIWPFNIPVAIKKVLFFRDMAIVVTNDSDGRNVVALNHDGEIVWRIPLHAWAEWISINHLGAKVSSIVPYTSVFVTTGDLYVLSSVGFRLRLDPATGEVLEALQGK